MNENYNRMMQALEQARFEHKMAERFRVDLTRLSVVPYHQVGSEILYRLRDLLNDDYTYRRIWTVSRLEKGLREVLGMGFVMWQAFRREDAFDLFDNWDPDISRIEVRDMGHDERVLVKIYEKTLRLPGKDNELIDSVVATYIIHPTAWVPLTPIYSAAK